MRWGRPFVLGVPGIAVSTINYAMEVKLARCDSFMASGKIALQVAPLPPLSLSLSAWGTWCNGITSASYLEGPGFKSKGVHIDAMGALASKLIIIRCFGPPRSPAQKFMNTHRGARTHDHKVMGLALCRLS